VWQSVQVYPVADCIMDVMGNLTPHVMW